MVYLTPRGPGPSGPTHPIPSSRTPVTGVTREEETSPVRTAGSGPTNPTAQVKTEIFYPVGRVLTSD